MSRRPSALPIYFACVLGIGAGLGVAWRLYARPGSRVTLSFLGGVTPQASGVRPSDGHTYRIWTVPGDVDALAQQTRRELTLSGGWQPPAVRQLSPRTIQFVRVQSPNGDFQFVRVLLVQRSPGVVEITIDEEPVQRHAFH